MGAMVSSNHPMVFLPLVSQETQTLTGFLPAVPSRAALPNLRLIWGVAQMLPPAQPGAFPTGLLAPCYQVLGRHFPPGSHLPSLPISRQPKLHRI